MKITMPSEDTISIVPETEFETEVLGRMFFANSDRKVVVKSGASMKDLMSVNIVVERTKVAVQNEVRIAKTPVGSIDDVIEQLKKEGQCVS